MSGRDNERIINEIADFIDRNEFEFVFMGNQTKSINNGDFVAINLWLLIAEIVLYEMVRHNSPALEGRNIDLEVWSILNRLTKEELQVMSEVVMEKIKNAW